MPLALYRIILFVQNVENLKNFYLDNFKLELVEEFDKEWVVLKAGLMEIAFHKMGPSPTYENTENIQSESNVKLVFQVDNGLAALRIQLLERGVQLQEIKSFPGFPAFFLQWSGSRRQCFSIGRKA
jgi:hypothetical protein